MARLRESAVSQQIAECRGNLAAVARKFGVTRQAVQQFVKAKGLAGAVEEARESMLDDAETALHTAVLRGEGWAVCFYLKTQGKRRGYIERGGEESGTSAGSVPVELVTQLLAKFGALASGTGAAPVGNAVGAESGAAIASLPQSC